MSRRACASAGISLVAGAVMSAIATVLIAPGVTIYGSVLFLGIGSGLLVAARFLRLGAR